MANSENLKQIMAKNLKKQLDRNGKSQTDLAKDLNIPETTVSNWMKANTYPRIDKIQLMADYFKIKRTDLTEEAPQNLTPIAPPSVKIPVLGDIACGSPIYAEQNFQGYRYRSPEGLPSGRLYILNAKGDSMEPTIPEGSEVMIREQEEVENGQIAAVLVNGDTEATLKRVKYHGDTMMLMPENSLYDPIIVSEDSPIKIIGRAVEVSRKL